MALSSGTRLAHYEILGSLGAGGMGEVYRASDTKLSRQVALKILPDAFSSDPERRARFAREAKSLAALNHPHIAQIYGFEDAGPTSALVMELVEGEDLSQRIRRGPIPFDEAIAIAKQIAEALEAAHGQGIVHRDLKPGNIKLRDDGTIKVLDFGLAKAIEGAGEAGRAGGPGGADIANSPTITSPAAMTIGGVILGTAAYMSPEQAKGRFVDKRADIWAFGCVLYEMLTARKAFPGEDVSDTLASVLKSDVDYTGVPPRATRLLKRCLEKDPKRRLHDIADAWDLIDEGTPVPQGSSASRAWVPWTLAALFLLSTIALVAMRVMTPSITPSPARFQITPPPKSNFDIYLALSPDGKRLAFTAIDANREITLWVRDLESLEARQLPGTEGAGSPFWSPDSRYLGFSAGRALKKIDASGGPPQTLTESAATVGIGSWSADGVILFGTRGVGPIRRVASTGGPTTDVTPVDAARGESVQSFPLFLPDGHRFLYWRQSIRTEFQGIYLGSIDKPASEQDNTPVLPTAVGPIVTASGPDGDRLLFIRDGTLMAQPFDLSRAKLSGEPAPIAEQIGGTGSYAFFSAAGGVLAFRNGTTAFVNTERLTWVDRKGAPIGTVGEPLALANNPTAIAIAPNGRQAAVMILAQTLNPDLWIVELGRGVASRFTFSDAPDIAPVWSPDSARIAFRTTRLGINIFAKDVNGTADESAMMPTELPGIPNDWSPDGRFLMFTQPYGASDLMALAVQDKTVMPLLQTPFSEQGARFSPDGRWIAYTSNESGGNEVYLRPFMVSAEGKPSLGPKWRVSTDSGAAPRWRGDGKELFYRNRNAAVMAADVIVKDRVVETGIPRLLFTSANASVGWDVTRDGQRFLMSFPAAANRLEQRPPEPITIVLNWQAALKK